MDITFLAQGYTADSGLSVGNQLTKYLSRDSFHTFTGITAFASEGGVREFSYLIKNAKTSFKSLNLIVGIDQDGTSKEALLGINDLNINSYIFFQRESPIFHPKIYLFEGYTETKLIVGSSNLTLKGLFLNVEGSLLVEFLERDEEGRKVVSELKDRFKGFFDFNDPNLFKLTPEIIDGFVADGIVPIEATRLRKDRKKTPNESDQAKPNVDVPPRAIARLPQGFKRKSDTDKTASKINRELEIEGVTTHFELSEQIWSKLNLKTSDILIPGKPSTNTTGRLKLTQAGHKIDHTTFFRFSLFKNYEWKIRPNSNKEDVIVRFKIVIDEIDKGDFGLTVTYNPKGESEQRNYTTWISWRGIGHIIREKNLTGKNLYLHKLESSNNTGADFAIVIA